MRSVYAGIRKDRSLYCNLVKRAPIFGGKVGTVINKVGQYEHVKKNVGLTLRMTSLPNLQPDSYL